MEHRAVGCRLCVAVLQFGFPVWLGCSQLGLRAKKGHGKVSRAITAVGEDPAAQEKLPQNFQARASMGCWQLWCS